MNISRLFGVLVVGGALLGTGSCASEDDRDRDEGQVVNAPDAADPAEPGADATTASDDSDAGELAPCFCNSEACCERHEDGSGTLQEGFECCWSTTC